MTEPQIRKAFVSCTQGEAKRLHVPRALPDQPWEHLDHVGWRDPQSQARGTAAMHETLTLDSASSGSWST